MLSAECRILNVRCAMCSVQLMKNRNVNQDGRKYLPGSPVATNYVSPPAGRRTHVTVKGSEAGATLVILADL